MSLLDPLDRIASDNPAVALPAIAQLRITLMDAERRAVGLAREQGVSWVRIAALLGQSRQTVWKRYTTAQRYDDSPLPPSTRKDGEDSGLSG